MASVSDADRALALLLDERPKFHLLHGEPHSWRISTAVLQWLARNVRSDQRTLETGSGYSTVIFAAAGATHTVISPVPSEHEKVCQWCKERDFTMNSVKFWASPSQSVLPTLDLEPLDLVLIDGSHAFPIPFLDWYHTSTSLKRKGFVLLDNTELRSVNILREFLLSERKRWRLLDDLGGTAIFQKVSDTIIGRLEFPAVLHEL